jgi:muramoyltetrapeptide carboxypeptidase
MERTSPPAPQSALVPPKLRVGDRVRLVSPASPPDQQAVSTLCEVLESWGLVVEFGDNVFQKYGYLAGTDEQRLADINAALRDPTVRAIIATRGGKGSYRIADELDFVAARRDPKFFVGISDNTILHMSLWKHCRLVGIHGALYVDERSGRIPDTVTTSLRSALMASVDVVSTRDDEATSTLTTTGTASGPLVGGNLDMVATAAGWALPDLHGNILFLEAIDMYLGRVDRQLTMLRKGGHLRGITGVAVGQFTKFSPSKGITIVELLRDHLSRLGVPILGGLPFGHGPEPLSVPLGAGATIDAAARTLTIRS